MIAAGVFVVTTGDVGEFGFERPEGFIVFEPELVVFFRDGPVSFDGGPWRFLV